MDLFHADLLPLLIDFVTWLGSGQQWAEFAADVLSTTLATLGRVDLQERLAEVRADRA